MRDFFKEIPFIRALYFKIQDWHHSTIIRLFNPITKSAYFKRKGPKLLHLGCGDTSKKGFLNSDIYRGDIYLNLLKEFPFNDNKFDGIYCHHVFEHFYLNEGEKILKEVHRVLNDGGIFRIIVPDLELVTNQEFLTEKGCLDYYANCMIKENNYESKWPLCLNELFHLNGEHKFIYNESLLKEMLTEVGFKNITRFSHGESNYDPFNAIDPHSGDCVAKISLCLEAVK